MKSALIFIAGVVVGMVGIYAWQGSEFQVRTQEAQISPIPLEDVLKRKAFAVSYGKPLRVEVVGSNDGFTLELTHRENGRVGYAWTTTTGEPSNGSGELFERYHDVASRPAGTQVEDAGGSVTIDLRTAILEWSAGSADTGYLYYNPDKVAIAYQTEE